MFAKAVKLKESSGADHQIPSNLFTYFVGSTLDFYVCRLLRQSLDCSAGLSRCSPTQVFLGFPFADQLRSKLLNNSAAARVAAPRGQDLRTQKQAEDLGRRGCL